MRNITRLLQAAGLALLMAAATACGGQADSSDAEEFPRQESGFTNEAENVQPQDQAPEPIEFP